MFDIVITGLTGKALESKIHAIKAIKVATGLGLKESKHLYDDIAIRAQQITPFVRETVTVTSLEGLFLMHEAGYVMEQSPSRPTAHLVMDFLINLDSSLTVRQIFGVMQAAHPEYWD